MKVLTSYIVESITYTVSCFQKIQNKLDEIGFHYKALPTSLVILQNKKIDPVNVLNTQLITNTHIEANRGNKTCRKFTNPILGDL